MWRFAVVLGALAVSGCAGNVGKDHEPTGGCGKESFLETGEQQRQRERCKATYRQAQEAEREAQQFAKAQSTVLQELESAKRQRQAADRCAEVERTRAAQTAANEGALVKAEATAARCDSAEQLVRAYWAVEKIPASDPRKGLAVEQLESCRPRVIEKARSNWRRATRAKRSQTGRLMEDAWDESRYFQRDNEFTAKVSGRNKDVLTVRSRFKIGPRQRNEDELFAEIAENARKLGFRKVTMRTPRKVHRATFDPKELEDAMGAQSGLAEPFVLTPGRKPEPLPAKCHGPAPPPTPALPRPGRGD